MASTQQRSAVGHVESSEAERTVYRGRDETRRFVATSEFWVMLLGVAAIAAIYHLASDASLNLWRASLLGAAIAIAYIVSRGVSKSGSPRDRWGTETRRTDSY